MGVLRRIKFITAYLRLYLRDYKNIVSPLSSNVIFVSFLLGSSTRALVKMSRLFKRAIVLRMFV